MSDSISEHQNCFYSVPWQKFLREAEKWGFKCGNTDIFDAQTGNISKKVTEEEVLLFNLETGLIIYAQSVAGKKMGPTILYGQLEGNFHDMTQTQHDLFQENVSSIKTGKGTIAFSMVVPRNFDDFMSKLLHNFTFLRHWRNGIIPNLLNYIQKKDGSVDHRSLNAEKLRQCSEDIKSIIGVE